AFAGTMYDRIGFQDTYLILGSFVLAITVVSAFTLTNTRQAMVSEETVKA
ncbi:MFS transporter, partial [Cronobacter sakazakii]|nr:MFS transporter [Cronobacter sakazakii]